jgi:hypothetical protein
MKAWFEKITDRDIDRALEEKREPRERHGRRDDREFVAIRRKETAFSRGLDITGPKPWR